MFHVYQAALKKKMKKCFWGGLIGMAGG